jgi:excisionase family DNA binding protein
MEQTYFSLAEVAAKLGVHPSTLRRAIKAGKLRTYRAGGHKHLITEEQIAQYLSIIPEPVEAR